MDNSLFTLESLSNAKWYNLWLIDHFKNYLSGDILEVGCGIGNFTPYLSNFGRLWAIDINKDYIKKTKKVNKREIKVGFGDIERGEFFFGKKRFDSIVCLNVLEHIKFDKKALINLYNLLEPNGYLILLVPSHQKLYGEIDKAIFHFRRYDKKTLLKLIKSVGLKTVFSKRLNFLGGVGWFISGKVLQNKSISKNKVLIFKLFGFIFLFFEKFFEPPIGTSILSIGKMVSNKKRIKLTIIVPVFNEEKTILKALQRVIFAKLPINVSKQILVVNDGSNDQTLNILKKNKKRFRFKLLNHKSNLGKGEAIKSALNHANGDIIVIQDADLEYHPRNLIKLLRPMLNDGYSVVFGTRLKNYPLRFWGKNKTILPVNWIANKFLSILTNILYGGKITDLETGYKMFDRKILDNIKLQSQSFNIEAEITAKILKNRIKIHEVPIKIKPRTRKEGKKIKLRDGFEAIYALFKYRFSD